MKEETKFKEAIDRLSNGERVTILKSEMPQFLICLAKDRRMADKNYSISYTETEAIFAPQNK